MPRLKRLSLLATAVRNDARVLWHALRHPQSPAWLKLGAVGLVAYALSPIDLLPDALPLLGVVDDVVLIPMALAFMLRKLPARVRDDARRKAGLPPQGEVVDA